MCLLVHSFLYKQSDANCLTGTATTTHLSHVPAAAIVSTIVFRLADYNDILLLVTHDLLGDLELC